MSKSKSASSSKSFSSNWTAWWCPVIPFCSRGFSRVRSIMLGPSWKDPRVFNIEESLEVDGTVKDSALLFRTGLIFGDLELSVLETFVKPVKPPIDCVDWRTFLNWSCILPSRAGLLEGNSCFARSFFGFGASYSLAARPSIASAIEEYVHSRPQALKAVRVREGGRGAFRQLASTRFVAEEQIGKITGLVVIQSKVPLGNS
jgi:hypothetical protein